MGVVAFDGALLNINLCMHPYLLLNCVHKYKDIYSAIGLLALKGIVVGESGSTPYVSISMPILIVFTNVQIFMMV